MSAEIQTNEAREAQRTLCYWISPKPAAFIKQERGRWMHTESAIRQSEGELLGNKINMHAVKRRV